MFSRHYSIAKSVDVYKRQQCNILEYDGIQRKQCFRVNSGYIPVSYTHLAMIEDGKNYGDFLLDTVETAKEQFTDKEYEWLKESATEISNIENRLTELEEKYPERCV